MIKLSLSDMAKILHVSVPSQNPVFQGVSIDSRQINAGNLFIALKGERSDGHFFINDARKQGAVAALVNRSIDDPLPQIIVKDTVDALGKLSQYWRNLFKIPVIGVTGSNGKTTLKNMIASILRAACHNMAGHVLATEGNLNNNIGLPLNLLRLDSKHQYCVLEMGMNHFGEIHYLTNLAKPRVAVITNAAECHLEGLQNVAGVAKAKGEIFKGLEKEGVAILNRDDAYFDYWRHLIGKQNLLTFGLKYPADISAIVEPHQPIILQTPYGKITVNLPLLGEHNVMNALAATAATLAISIDLGTIKRGLEQVAPTSGRMCEHILANGVRIIDDTYNANPFSLEAAVNTLKSFQGKKVIVLGDMKELGPDAKTIHLNSGKKMREAGIDYLFTLGELSAETATGFGENALHFTERDALIHALKPHLTTNVTVLIKGSRSMKMEKILAIFLPEHMREFNHGH